MQNVSSWRAPFLSSRRARLDAIIVPASRPASSLQPIINLATSLGAFLAVLCSSDTKAEHVAERVAQVPGARSLIIQIPLGWMHSGFPIRTSDPEFRLANADRESDLSLKRNLGLLLARLHGWNKVAFLDDDITLSDIDNITRLAWQLDRNQVAGMVVPEHPDNSVVCHARRLAGLFQDVFLTGAALGVHCNSLPLSFFPDIYNEDWFFAAKEAAARKLPHVGEATQVKYNPYDSPDRARQQEFGDLLAEGLYALIGKNEANAPFGEQLGGATKAYWSQFIDARHDVITEAKSLLNETANQNGKNGHITSALASLAAAESQLDTLTPDICVNFIDAWRDDLDDWKKFSTGVSNVGSTREAMNFLQLKTWTWVEFGEISVETAVATAA